jgi:protein-L-isoaspartate(D-aspartate) O-methyltransferase
MVDGRQRQHHWEELRQQMVEDQLRRRGITDQRVLDAMLAVPREQFIPENVRPAAYEDRALPIGHDQTISQPYIVAYMTQHLAITAEARVLEIGTGTGYQTTLLALLAGHVYTVERIAALRQRAAANLDAVNVTGVTMSVGDGSLGWREHAPYDRILATAAAPTVPGPLVNQLVDNGVMVLPVGGRAEQTIVRVVRKGKRTIETPMLACRFVKLIGEAGWGPG